MDDEMFVDERVLENLQNQNIGKRREKEGTKELTYLVRKIERKKS